MNSLNITGTVHVSGLPANQTVQFGLNGTGCPNIGENSDTLTFEGSLVNGAVQVAGLGDTYTVNLTLIENIEEESVVTQYTLIQQELQFCPNCSQMVTSLSTHIETCRDFQLEVDGHNMSCRASFLGGRFFYININCVICPSCGGASNCSRSLALHLEDEHSAIIDYVCRRCPFSSDYISNMLTHVIVHHN